MRTIPNGPTDASASLCPLAVLHALNLLAEEHSRVFSLYTIQLPAQTMSLRKPVSVTVVSAGAAVRRGNRVSMWTSSMTFFIDLNYLSASSMRARYRSPTFCETAHLLWKYIQRPPNCNDLWLHTMRSLSLQPLLEALMDRDYGRAGRSCRRSEKNSTIKRIVQKLLLLMLVSSRSLSTVRYPPALDAYRLLCALESRIGCGSNAFEQYCCQWVVPFPEKWLRRLWELFGIRC